VRDNLERDARIHLNRVVETPTYHVDVSCKKEWVAATPVAVTKKVEEPIVSIPTSAAFQDKCTHLGPHDEFLGCVRLNGRAYDVYVFDNMATGVMHVCLRFGDAPADYLSPGPVETFINWHSGEEEIYTSARPLVVAWLEKRRSRRMLPVHGMWPGSNANERFTFLGTVVSEDDRKFDVWIRTYAGEHRVYIRFDGGRYTYTDHGVVAEFLSKSSRSSVENIAVMMVRSWDAEQLSRSWAAGLGASAQKEKKS